MIKHINAKDLVAYALDAVGGGYVYGSSGEVCSPKFRESCAAANPSQRENILGTSAKWDGKRVWDCSGLFRGAWRKLWQYRSGGATTIYKTWCARKGTIDAMPDTPGVLVFRGTPSNMAHIGIYVGGGMVVDARGSSQGVLHGTFESYKAGWSHWGLADDVDYFNDIPAPEEILPLWSGTVKTRTGSGVSLWTDNTKKIAVAKVRDGQIVDILGEMDDKGFAQARYGGKTGVADLTYVVPPDAETPSQNTYRATVTGVRTGLNLYREPVRDAKNKGILLIPNGGVVEVFPDMRSGEFAYVLYLGHAGYCTDSYLRKQAEEVAV